MKITHCPEIREWLYNSWITLVQHKTLKLVINEMYKQQRIIIILIRIISFHYNYIAILYEHE